MRNILLATDLTARSDRALDRAARLARDSGAKLTVAHAIEDVKGVEESVNIPSWRRGKPAWKRLDALKTSAEAQIRDQVGEQAQEPEIVITQEKAPDLLFRLARERAFDLIVTGVARDSGQGSVVLGSTVERLIKSGLAPVLVVKCRPVKPYETIVAASDLSPTSAEALRATLDLCTASPIAVLHAYETEEEGISAQTLGENDPAFRKAKEDAERFVAEAADSEKNRVKLVLEPGKPLSLLNSYAADHEADLVTLGTHGRTGFFARLLGSVAERVLLSAPCDVLVVRGAKS